MSATVIDEVRQLAGELATRLEGHWDDEVLPHASRLLTESATVAIRAASGEDVSIAQVALDASMKNLTRAQQAVVLLEGRHLALRAAMAVIAKLAAV